MKKINKINLILSLSFLMAVGCNDTSVNNQASNNVFSGKIENWSYGKDKDIIAKAQSMDTTYRLIVIDSTRIDSSGNFTLTLNTPPDSIISKLNMGYMCAGNINVNPSNSKFAVVVLLEVHDTGHTAGSLLRSSENNYPPVNGECLAYFFYSNQGASITGKDSCNSGLDVYNWNCNFGAGWNYIYILYNTMQNLSITSTQSLTFKWYYIP